MRHDPASHARAGRSARRVARRREQPAAPRPPRPPSPPVAPAKIRIGTLPTEDALPLWVAEQDGLFEKAGLDGRDR